jgi:RNA polymerase-binding transcription factor DksA
MTIELEELADDIDRASVDQSQSLTFRLRRRERMLLDKIE